MALLLLLFAHHMASAQCGTGADGAFSPVSSTTLPGGTYHYTSVNIPVGVTITVTGTQPLVINCTGNVLINGSLQANGSNGEDGITYNNAGTGGIGVAGGTNGGNGSFASGSGPLNGSAGLGPGAGGMGQAWSGGGGAGHSLEGNDAFTERGLGGPAYGDANLTIVYGGSGGGGGSGGYDCGAGGGGGGGGSIQILACGTVTVNGSIEAKGGNGGSDGGGNCGGGGGGSGGSILLRGSSVTQNGVLNVSGGTGGASDVSGIPYYGTGANGAPGRTRLVNTVVDNDQDGSPAGVDCDDNDSSRYPGNTEVCDGKDNDCDGAIDEQQAIGAPWSSASIGQSGSSMSNPCPANAPQFILSAKGFSTPNSDVIQTTYQSLCGNASITVHIAGLTGGGWAGISMRESNAAGSKMVALKTQLTNFVRREVRSVLNGAKTSQQFTSLPEPTWLRIQRSGNVFSYFTSTNGTTWAPAGSQTLVMSNCVLVGMFAESINANTTTTATFDHVTVSGGTPPPALAAFDSGFEAGVPDFTLYPNPTSGMLNLQVPLFAMEENPLQINVFNSLGNAVSSTQVMPAAESLELDQLNGLPNGVYWVQIQAKGQTPVTKRIVLQR